MGVSRLRVLVTLLVFTSVGGWARSVSHGGESIALLATSLHFSSLQSDEGDGRPENIGEPAETQAISEIHLGAAVNARTSGRTSLVGDGAMRLVQIGNPPRRPRLPDLSREGRADLPGRLSLEVPSPGVRWQGSWLPPGIYRLALVTDGFEVMLAAKPLSPGPEILLPVEIGSMTAPSPRFRATLSLRTVEHQRTGHFLLRWGVMILEAQISTPPPTVVSNELWNLSVVPDLIENGEEMYFGTLVGNEDGGGTLEARWIRMSNGDQRLRLERSRRRRMFALRREYLARAARLLTIASSQTASGDAEAGAKTLQTAKAYEERAAQLEPHLAALEGTNREIVGQSRPGRGGETPQFRLESRGGQLYLIIDRASGGAEFRLP